MRFTYDDLSRIKRAEDDAAHWSLYEYNADGMLKSVILSSGRERHYEYDGVSMKLVTDEKGRVLIHNSYQGRFLRQQQFENGAIYSYSYDWTRGEYYPRKVRVTLPDRTTRELSVGDSVPDFVRNYHKQ